MTNEELIKYSKVYKTEIGKILKKYYRNDPYLLEELRVIVSDLIKGNCSYNQLEDMDRELEELGSPWGLCASFIRPLSYEMIVSLRQYINDECVKMEKAMYC